MNYELHLVSATLKSADAGVAVKTLVGAGDIFILHKPKVDWLLEYYRDYDAVPSLEAFYNKFGLQLPEPQDPISFYVDKCTETAMFHRTSEVYDALGEQLKKMDPMGAAKTIQEKALELAKGFSIGKDVDYAENTEDRIQAYLDRQNCPQVYGIPSGWPVLDNYTTGWQESTFTVLFSKSKSYKSWILLFWALNAWMAGKRVLFYSREMPASHLYKRVDALLTRTPYKFMRYGFPDQAMFDAFAEKLRSHMAMYNKNRFIVMDVTGMGSLPELEYIHSKVAVDKPDILFVDGIYLIGGKGQSDWERVKSVTNGLKQVCMDRKIPVVGTTQATKKASGKNLDKSDIAYGPSFEQDVDLLLSINRLVDPVKESLSNELLIKTSASRDGEDLEFKVTPDFDTMTFTAEMHFKVDVVTEDEYNQPF